MRTQHSLDNQTDFFIPSQDFEPAYMRLYRSGELQRRAREAVASLADCHVCPRDCGVDRLADKTAACKTGRYARVGSYFPHFGEEDCLRGWNGSGTIFFSWCNLRCVFCFHPDTFISTDQGLMTIAEIFERGASEQAWKGGFVRFGDGSVRVITREGRLAKVAKMFCHPFKGDLIKIKPFNCPPLLLTPNHEIFAAPKSARNLVAKMLASELTKEYYLLAPKRAPVIKDVTWEVVDALTYQTNASRGALDSVLTAQMTGRRHAAWSETEHWYLVPIHKIERIPYAGPVFNLEVDDPDHSYLASSVVVSNCQNYDISQAGNGQETRPERLAEMMLELQALGCHNINFVTPEHVVPQILEALPLAIERGLRLPIVYNTSSYDSLDSLRYMDGVVDIYMPDFKVWDSRTALKYLLAKDYPEAARRVVKEMHRQVGELKMDENGLAKRGVLVRHLVMPGEIAGTREIMEFLAREVSPHTYVNVMAQYYPAGRVSAEKFAEINRHITRREHADAVAMAREVGLYRFDERRGIIVRSWA